MPDGTGTFGLIEPVATTLVPALAVTEQVLIFPMVMPHVAVSFAGAALTTTGTGDTVSVACGRGGRFPLTECRVIVAVLVRGVVSVIVNWKVWSPSSQVDVS